MGNDIFLILGASLGLLSFLFWLVYDIQLKQTKQEKEKKGYCPLCGHVLEKGQKLRSEQVEIPKVEIKTFLKGCPHCLGILNSRTRKCPVCKTTLAQDQTVIAISYFDDPKKLSIKGCKKCYPEGYIGYEAKYK